MSSEQPAGGLVRPAQEDDSDAVARVRARAVVEAAHYPDATDEEVEFRRFLPRIAGYLSGAYSPRHFGAERAVFVAEREREIVGFIAGHRTTRMGCAGELQWMFVLPAWQRRGVGAMLLAPLAAWFRAEGAGRVLVDAPPEIPTRAFYLKHGAVPLDEYWLYWPEIGATPAGEG